MSEITGYIDRDIVKGHTYRLAGCPVPTVFTGDIDVISDDILVKAMVVVDNGNGTFPKTTSDRYLITTVEYGNSVYLQSAVDSGANEYRRIYSDGQWSKWLSVSAVVDGVKDSIDSIDKAEKTDRQDIDSLGLKVNGTEASPGLMGRMAKVEESVGTISQISTKLNNKIQQVTITQNVKMSTVGETFGKFQLGTELVYPTDGVLIGMRVNTSHPGNITGVVYMLTYAANGTKPYINYQKGPNVTFNESHDFIFTFYVP